MIIVTVLREKLIHSETIRENQTIKSDQSDDVWRSGSVHFPLSRRQEAAHLYITHRSEDDAPRAASNWPMTNFILKPRIRLPADCVWSEPIPTPINDNK